MSGSRWKFVRGQGRAHKQRLRAGRGSQTLHCNPKPGLPILGHALSKVEVLRVSPVYQDSVHFPFLYLLG